MSTKVNVYDDFGTVVARVEYNQNLDFWDGHNWTCGSMGHHAGLTRLRKSKQYVIIHGSDYQGERDSAEIISDKLAYQHIVSSGNIELLEKFPELQRFEENIDTDADPEEKTTIQLTKELKNKLSDLKVSPDETYQDVIERMFEATFKLMIEKC